MQPERVVSLSSMSVIVAEGPDAEQFLQAQLTNSLQTLAADQHQLTGYCSAKGRLLAIARLWRLGQDRIALLLPADIAPGLVKRLGMFVLRAKLRLSLAQAQVEGLWFGGSGEVRDAGEAGSVSRGAKDSEVFLLWLGAAGADQLRALRVSLGLPSQASGADPIPALPGWFSDSAYAAQSDEEARQASQEWEAADIRAGLPWVWASTQDLFVPQMVNLELMDGVNFQKGCYPGQEVVARSQYLGKLNRRMFGVSFSLNGAPRETGLAGASPMPPMQSLAHSRPPPIAPGCDVFSPSDPSQPCGTLVAAAQASPGRLLGLVSVSLDAWAEGGLRLHSPEGPLLEPFALPYAVPTTPQTPNRPKL
jgi:folate-binding protein YgfZ